MRRTIAVFLFGALWACSAGPRTFTPEAAAPSQTFDRPASTVTYTIEIQNRTSATLHQVTDYHYCASVAPQTADVRSHQSLPVTVEIDRSKCKVSAAFSVRYHEDGAPKTTFATLAFDYRAPNKRYPHGAKRFNGRAYNGLCGEYAASAFKIFEGKPPTSGCYTWPQTAVTPHASRSFALTIENASGVALSGLTKSSFCMSSTPGGALPTGTTPYTVSTFGRSWMCEYDADFTTYYWVPSAPLTDVVSVQWVYEAPATRVYAAGYQGFCTNKVSETHVRITKC